MVQKKNEQEAKIINMIKKRTFIKTKINTFISSWILDYSYEVQKTTNSLAPKFHTHTWKFFSLFIGKGEV